jgi:uncharacterized delta-60 repeat protein
LLALCRMYPVRRKTTQLTNGPGFCSNKSDRMTRHLCCWPSPPSRFAGGSNMRKILVTMIVGVIVVSVSLIALSVIQETTWGGVAGDEADDIAIAPDGSVYVTGTTFSFGRGDPDAFLLKYSAAGVLQWQRTYALAVTSPLASAADFGFGVAAAADGSAYITGQLGDGNLFLVKFDAAGNPLWQLTWGDPGHFVRAVEVAADGAIYVAGGTFTFGVGQADALLLKFTSDGTPVWARTWGGASRDALEDITIGADGGIYMVGETSSFFWNDAFVVKFAPDGTLLWQREWGTMGDVAPNDSAAWGVGTAADGSVYVSGTSNTEKGSMAVLKFDSSGALIWQRVASPAFNLGFDVAAAGGNVYVTGHGNFEPGHSDAFIITLLANGKAREAASWGGLGSEAGRSIALASGGNTLIAGAAGAPPYAVRRVSPRMTTPDGFLMTPGGTVTAVDGAVRVPLGIVTAPNGSTTFAGATDVMLLRVQP